MKAFVLPLLAALLLAACESAPPPQVTAPPRSGMARGVDIATDARDVSQELKGSGLEFVARYYRHATSRWPTLTLEEARTVSSSGIKLVTVFESHSHKADYFSYATGFTDGMTAYQQAKAIGQPADSAIYFAVDYNAPQSDIQGQVDRYFRGVRAGFAAAGGNTPAYRVGVYGSGAVCGYMKRMRLVEYAWLSGSTAWYGSDSFTDWNIRQSRRTMSVSFNHTMNEARGEYGAFTLVVPATSS